MSGNPTLTERQETLLMQAKNCRDLAHFLSTDPRVEGHFAMHAFCHVPGESAHSGTLATRPEILHSCGSTACAGGWAIYMGIIRNVDELYKAFGLGDSGSGNIFGSAPRSRHAEARILERHARRLEAQL